MENLTYKHNDYLLRSNDYYALTKYQIVMNLLPKKQNLNVLNAGCGSGEMNILLAQNNTWKVTAIDIDEESILLSQNIQKKNNIENLTIIKSSIEEHIPNEKYDIIVSNDVLEHIEDDNEAVKKFSLLLKKDGILCVSVPSLNYLFGYHDVMLGHYRRYNRKNCTKLLSSFFNIEKCRYFGGILIPAALLYSKIIKKPYPIGNANEKSVISKLVKLILNFEKKVTLPLGTSLIAMGKLKSEK